MKNYNKIKFLKLILIYPILILTVINFANSKEILEYPTEIINFGAATRDDLPIKKIFEIRNKTKFPIRFDRYIILNDDEKPSQVFRFDPPTQLPPNGVPFDLLPDTEYDFQLMADVQKANIGINRGYLRFFNDKIKDSIEIKLLIIISIDSLIIQIPNLTQNLNDTFNLPIFIRGSKVAPNIDAVELTLKFNQTILTPENPEDRGNIENGFQIIKKRFDINFNVREKLTDTLGFIPMIAMLGNSVFSDIEILQVDWLRNNVILPKVPTITYNGKLFIDDIFFDDGVPRLVSFSDEFVSIKELKINNYNLHIEIEYCGNTPNILLSDYLGNTIFNSNEINLNNFITQCLNTKNCLLVIDYSLDNLQNITQNSQHQQIKSNNLLYFLNVSNNKSNISKKLVIFDN